MNWTSAEQRSSGRRDTASPDVRTADSIELSTQRAGSPAGLGAQPSSETWVGVPNRPAVVGRFGVPPTGQETTVNQLYDMLGFLMDHTTPAQHIVPRLGDLKKSVLNNSKAKNLLKWEPTHDLKAGLQETIKYYRKPK